MASTQNKNMPGEYCLQQVAFKQESNYTSYKGKRLCNKNFLPCAGILPGQVPAQVLSKNSTDCESFLFGINSSNLVNPTPKVSVQLNCLPGLSFYSRLQPLLPQPLVIENCQRPEIFRR